MSSASPIAISEYPANWKYAFITITIASRYVFNQRLFSATVLMIESALVVVSMPMICNFGNTKSYDEAKEKYWCHPPSLQISYEFRIPVNGPDDQNRKKEIIGEVVEQAFILNSLVVPLDCVVNVSENVIRHSQRDDPVIVYREKKLCSSYEQHEYQKTYANFNCIAEFKFMSSNISERYDGQYPK